MLIYRIGDVCAEDHGGGALVRHGSNWTLEYTHGAESDQPDADCCYGSAEERRLPLTLYRVDVATTTEGARSDLSWCDWSGIAQYTGVEPAEIFALALSNDPRKLAALYEMAAEYHGWGELDLYPIELPYWRVARRWNGRDEQARKLRRKARRVWRRAREGREAAQST